MRNHFRMRWFGVSYVLTVVGLLVALGASHPVSAHEDISTREMVIDPPVRVTLRPDGGERVDGDLLRYDTATLTVQPRDGDALKVPWASIRAARALWIFERTLDHDDARGWFEAAVLLFAYPDQRNEGERALTRALRADPSLEPLAEAVRAGEVVAWPDPHAEPVDADAHEDAETDQEQSPATADAEGRHANVVPQNVGELQAQFWGDLSPELMSSSVEELKQEAQQAQQEMGLQLRLYEDDNFLVYTDLPAKEAKNWTGLLDDMYERLIETFDLPKGKNIFRGKCLIYILRDQSDYYRLCAVALKFNAMGSAGVCQSRGDGYAVVAFYRQPNTLDFAHVLVHEAVHAFVHRYRSHPFIPSWVNEGLAEHIAHKLVQNRGFGQSNFASNEHDARRWLRHYGSMRGMFNARPIAGWQYPVAGQLCGFMIAQSPKRYKAFIDALKDGKPWSVALVEDYGITPERLAEAFGESIDVRDLRP
ncbi:MAG: hypothetical protein AAF328_07245 [Planctomycetota bacterium]